MDAVSREQARLSLTRGILRDLRKTALRASLAVRDEQGRYPVVPCLDDDTVSWVFDRVRELGGTAIVVMGTEVEPGIYKRDIVVMGHGSTPIPDEEPCKMHPHTEIGLLVAYLREHGGVVHCQVLAPDGIAQLATTPA